jgi:hypothetical protein
MTVLEGLQTRAVKPTLSATSTVEPDAASDNGMKKNDNSASVTLVMRIALTALLVLCFATWAGACIQFTFKMGESRGGRRSGLWVCGRGRG